VTALPSTSLRSIDLAVMTRAAKLLTGRVRVGGGYFGETFFFSSPAPLVTTNSQKLRHRLLDPCGTADEGRTP